MTKLPIFDTTFQNSFQVVVDWRILVCQTLWYYNGSPLNIRQNLKKRPLLFRSEIGVFDIFFKKVLRVYKSKATENFKSVPLCSIKFFLRATMFHKVFVKMHKSPLLIANTVKALFVLKILKFLSWLFGHLEITVWLEKED